ncbi:MAG: peptidase M3 [Bdellovibrionales bacterium RIFOXYD12_FULL_39_22]|nr:MAG: peptidase M3 [Bdellovibrionales bacterium RIFOXYB1_FULL_39_21]OFZ41575.1 MAG: peptidase M3 [Bdellovibrionales bacterium RIFOXYC12_FULL_39_17]OFZ45888.1 MAG: peptidase M3 [Bdellovibrionales bacterium RIFOXYC1_FULL_39_130]OFZ74820.1 MAG: peptidase M3 [Bdellovibrionales bacterium RIFOXYD1_FULL_39_84]OFZ92680.1 MAG: peptidase M3 [Bdellovibrionales bacterium RIFOXYD12_FULL_39_22]HLE11271.1 M3 family metallopeptidase [Bacteriovoracaceae bacterium]
MNILLEDFKTPFQVVPFDKISDDDFIPAIKEAIQVARTNIEEIKNNKHEATFENTIVALDNADLLAENISSIFFNLHGADTSPKRQAIAKEISPLLAEFGNDVTLDEKLFAKIEIVYKKRKSLNLKNEELTLLEKTYKTFVRNGVGLAGAQKERLRALDKSMSELTLKFGDNYLHETNSYQLHLMNKQDLSGLPDSLIEDAANAAKENNKEGWIFTLNFPSYIPFLKYADNRQLRETMYKAAVSRCFKSNDYDNQAIVKEIAALRFERANLLGYKTHADFVLDERMAKTPTTVLNFLDEILRYARPVAEREMEGLRNFMRELGHNHPLERWDYSYYAEKLKKKMFNLDDEVLRPYFRLENVVNGVFTVANKLYGITFKKNSDIPVYHPDVETYEVLNEQGRHLGIFYTDFFPRPGKRNGAWMTSFRNQQKIGGTDLRPHISIVCNFSRPSSNRPSLLTYGEVTTLFHEFGHALHGLLSNITYKGLSGTSVYWDFVELPSQIMENWVAEKECLDLFANHYETGEKIPASYVESIKKSATFHEGYATVRQLSLGLLDMGWHADNPSKINNILNFETEMGKKTELFPLVPEGNTSCGFAHIFSGGYSSGYYSYKWAEVLDADAFEFFLEKGIFNKEVAHSFYENILSKGGSEHPAELYRRFRGKNPDVRPLLKRGGLIS